MLIGVNIQALLPKLRAKPVRTASGVTGMTPSLLTAVGGRCGCHVQASPMPAHLNDR